MSWLKNVFFFILSFFFEENYGFLNSYLVGVISDCWSKDNKLEALWMCFDDFKILFEKRLFSNKKLSFRLKIPHFEIEICYFWLKMAILAKIFRLKTRNLEVWNWNFSTFFKLKIQNWAWNKYFNSEIRFWAGFSLTDLAD